MNSLTLFCTAHESSDVGAVTDYSIIRIAATLPCPREVSVRYEPAEEFDAQKFVDSPISFEPSDPEERTWDPPKGSASDDA